MKRWLLPTTILLALAPMLGVLAAGQQPEPPPRPHQDEDAMRKEMQELFAAVERKLRQIDRLLYDAGAGGKLEEPVEDGGIDRLLQQVSDQSRDVQQGIDRILEIARQSNSQQQPSSGGQGQGQEQNQQQGDSPLDQQRPEKRTERDQAQGSKAPRAPGEQEPSRPKEEPGSQRPKDSREKDSQPEQRTGGEAPRGATERAEVVNDRERWGELPQYARDVFRVEGGGDLPPQYRDWIDAYYRRLSQRR